MNFKNCGKYTLALAIVALVATQTWGASSILSTSLRKVSDNGLNLTFYTNGDTSEKPIVKDKGGNQYVILLPNYTDSSRNVDLRSVSDLVSDYDVKTINEGAITYTKVSLKTQKPVNVNVQTRKTSQSASDISGMNDIISKVNLINKDIKSTQNAQTNKPQAQTNTNPQSAKTAVLPKVSNVSDILRNKNNFSAQPQQVVKKEEPQQNIAPQTPIAGKSIDAHVPSVTKTVNKQKNNNLTNENIKNVRTEAVKKLDALDNNIKSAEQTDIALDKNEENSNYTPEPVETEIIPEWSGDIDLPPLPGENNFDFSNIKSSIHKFLTSPLAIVVGILMLGALLMLALMKYIKKLLTGSDEINNSFIERMNLNTTSSQTKKAADIANDNTLNWQEKYATYKHNNSTKSNVETSKANYTDEDLDIENENIDSTSIDSNENYHYEFEQAKRAAWNENTYNYSENNTYNNEYDKAQSSETAITNSLKREFTGFQDRRSLKKVVRNTGITNRFTRFDTNAQVKRNLNELLDTIIQLDEEKTKTSKATKNDSSVIEQKSPKKIEKSEQKISNKKVSATKTSVNEIKKIAETNPIKKKLKITKSRAIDNNKGFYLVDMNDKLALMGRVNDKFIVLKKFDDKNKTTLQVRRDKDNLYMVRTDGFKALVDVEDEKMGVFAEL